MLKNTVVLMLLLFLGCSDKMKLTEDDEITTFESDGLLFKASETDRKSILFQALKNNDSNFWFNAIITKGDFKQKQTEPFYWVNGKKVDLPKTGMVYIYIHQTGEAIKTNIQAKEAVDSIREGEFKTKTLDKLKEYFPKDY